MVNLSRPELCVGVAAAGTTSIAGIRRRFTAVGEEGVQRTKPFESPVELVHGHHVGLVFPPKRGTSAELQIRAGVDAVGVVQPGQRGRPPLHVEGPRGSPAGRGDGEEGGTHGMLVVVKL